MNIDELLADSKISKSLNTIETQFNWYKWRLKFALNENKKLKEKNYKDEELAAMKQEVEEMKKALSRSFLVSEDEWKRINEWKHKHEIEKHGLDTDEKRMNAHGCCGGNWKFVFLPTSLGVIGTVKCETCGEEYCFAEIE